MFLLFLPSFMFMFLLVIHSRTVAFVKEISLERIIFIVAQSTLHCGYFNFSYLLSHKQSKWIFIFIAAQTHNYTEDC